MPLNIWDNQETGRASMYVCMYVSLTTLWISEVTNRPERRQDFCWWLNLTACLPACLPSVTTATHCGVRTHTVLEMTSVFSCKSSNLRERGQVTLRQTDGGKRREGKGRACGSRKIIIIFMADTVYRHTQESSERNNLEKLMRTFNFSSLKCLWLTMYTIDY